MMLAGVPQVGVLQVGVLQVGVLQVELAGLLHDEGQLANCRCDRCSRSDVHCFHTHVS